MTGQAKPSKAAPPPIRRIGGQLAVILVASVSLLAPLCGRTLVDGRAELARAEAAAEAGDHDAAIRHLGRAARFRLPLANHDELALSRLRELALDAEAGDRTSTALAAWRELRSALIGTRVLDVADPELLAEANAAIVDLMIHEARAADRPIARERWADELEQDLAPRHRSLLAAACFAGWLVACVGFFVRGIDGKGRLIPRPALRWGGLALLLLVAWLLLM
ncbi:MAG TPA: hypothetical protein VK034_07385 [Enhygromyxa sp.]|nr:hypothetical protein [Enhygromyxa sp.]